ncbi:MAG: MFS transporter, partial [Gemmataceae bacterium]
RWVLVGSAALCLGAVLLFGPLGGAWRWVTVGVVAIGSAIYSPTRYALLPAAADDTRWPLTRINGFIELGAVLAVAAGMVLGGYLYSWEETGPLGVNGLPLAIVAAMVLNLIGVVAAWPVWFAADVRRPEAPLAAVSGFFRDLGRVWRQPVARGSLLGAAALRGLAAAVVGAVVASALSSTDFLGKAERFEAMIQVGLWIMAGTAAGSLLAGVQGHPRRSLGIIPFAATGLAFFLLLAVIVGVPPWLCLALGLCGGLLNVPLNAAYQENIPADARGNGLSVFNLFGFSAMMLLAGLMASLGYFQVLTPTGQLALLGLLAVGGAAWAWKKLLREALEQTLEIILWPMYRFQALGPGVGKVPLHGPLLVIANHSAYMDPLWMGKVIPRKLTPMMTSIFYDMPMLRFLMTKIVHAIRVESSSFRREVPELKEALGVLDRGEALLIFPEGWVRRTREQLLRKFGQGVWLLLRERPQTPVVVCWIEGGFGSWTSYDKGKPLTNKPIDLWYPLRIVITEPQVLPPDILADQRQTRAYLMRCCLEARQYLGLEVPNELDQMVQKGIDPEAEEQVA